MDGLMTENLYLGAYALSQGARLKRVVVTRTNGRSMAAFEIESPWASKLNDEFYAQTAIVNVSAYIEKVSELRDALFAALRESERKRGTKDEEIRRGRARREWARG